MCTRPRTGPALATTLGEGLGLRVLTDASSTVLELGSHQLRLDA